MRFKEITEGGWASTLTQGTKITPVTVARTVKVLTKFEAEFNSFLTKQKIAPIEMGNPAGSATYYKRDLQSNPNREYGDVDVNMFVPEISGLTNNANMTVYANKIKEFCDITSIYGTKNGTNVIFQIGDKEYVQVDFIMAFHKNKEWTNVLAPAYNVKGVLCNSLYSSLAEALSISMGGPHGVQAKTQNGVLVSFKLMKDVELHTITTDPKTWAVDVVKYFGCKKISPLLSQYSGMGDEVRVQDIINSIRGIARTLELNGKRNAKQLLKQIANIYDSKIQKAISSSKFDKAATPEAVAKAQKTKELLSSKSKEILSLIK